jgi:hypothetical protein
MIDEMLVALTRGIGAELGKKIRFSYYEKKRLIQNDDIYRACQENEKSLFLDLLALAIFHEFAIGPMHGSNNFYSSTKKYGVNSISLGSFKVDDEFNKQTLAITKAFFSIMSEYNIEINQLSVSSPHEFLINNRDFILEWQKQ